MALLEEQFTETLDAGAPDITYQGNEGKEQKIARELWDNLPPEAQQQFGSFQQFFSSGAWKQVLQMLQQQMQQQAPQQMSQQPQQGLGSMMPAQMADGGMLMASDPGFGDGPFMLDQYLEAVKNGYKGTYEDFINDIDRSPADYMAYGGIAGADGRRQYGIGSWFQKKIMDPIKKNPLVTAAVLGAGSSLIPGLPTSGWMGSALKGIKGSGIGSALGSIVSDPKWMIPAASLVAGAFAKPEQQLEGGAMSRGAGINLQDIAKLANITDEKQGQAIGLNFLPEASARKYSPEEMALTYSQAGKAQGGRIGYADGTPEIPEQFLEDLQRRDFDRLLDDYRRWQEHQERQRDFGPGGQEVAQGGRIGAQEGGLMSLGGMEMDLRGGGFVPLGAKEKADDVPARLSKNEFVFTADAVRAAGGGDVDAGADKMYNTMKQLESRVV